MSPSVSSDLPLVCLIIGELHSSGLNLLQIVQAIFLSSQKRCKSDSSWLIVPPVRHLHACLLSRYGVAEPGLQGYPRFQSWLCRRPGCSGVALLPCSARCCSNLCQYLVRNPISSNVRILPEHLKAKSTYTILSLYRGFTAFRFLVVNGL